jgi:hypothetical protein
MTFIDTSAISDAVQTVLFKPERSISVQGTTPEGVSRTIIADVTVEEDMRDVLDITDHPVEGTGRGVSSTLIATRPHSYYQWFSRFVNAGLESLIWD